MCLCGARRRATARRFCVSIQAEGGEPRDLWITRLIRCGQARSFEPLRRWVQIVAVEVGGVMRAVVVHETGDLDVLRVEEVERPVPGNEEVLIRVFAASVNPLTGSTGVGWRPGSFRLCLATMYLGRSRSRAPGVERDLELVGEGLGPIAADLNRQLPPATPAAARWLRPELRSPSVANELIGGALSLCLKRSWGGSPGCSGG